MIEIIYFCFVAVLSAALGQRIFRILKVRFELYLEEMAFAFPMGLAALAYIVFFLGILGFLYSLIVIIMTIIFCIILRKEIKQQFLSIYGYTKNFKNAVKKHKLGKFYLLSAFFIFLLIALNFLVSLSPPYHYDVLAYHLTIPKLYINAHKIVYLPSIFYSNLPMLVETIYMLGMLLHGAILSNLIACSMGVALSLAIFLFCRRFFGIKVAILASLTFYSFPMVIRLAHTPHVDVQFALFVFMGLYALFLYLDSQDIKFLMLSSIFAGLGISSKIFGIVAFLGIFAVLLIHLFGRLKDRKISFRYLLKMAVIFCFIAFILVFPWLLKSYMFTDNPVWPFLSGVFKSKYWDSEHQEHLLKIFNLRELTIMSFIRLPWDIQTQAGSSTANIDDDDGIGPYFMAFLPLYFILPRKNRMINIFFIVLLIYLAVWFFLTTTFRYIIFSWPIIAIIAAYVAVELMGNKALTKFLKLILLFTFVFGILFWTAANAKAIKVSLGLQSQNDFYLKNIGPIYKASKFINSNLPDSSRILLFRDNRGYFIDKQYVLGDPLLQSYIDYSKFKNEQDMYNELKHLGITHILTNNEFEWRGFIFNEYRYNTKIVYLMDRLLKKSAISLYNYGGIEIYELK